MIDTSQPFSLYITKGSHNSYQRKEQVVDQVTSNSPNRFDLRCGCIELDINQSDDDPHFFSVNHDGGYKQLNRQFSQFLSELRVWSFCNPEHTPVTIFIDVKHASDAPNFSEIVDEFIAHHLSVDHRDVDATILSPRWLYKHYGASREQYSLRGLLETYGWPSLPQLAGKFIVVFTGNYNLSVDRRLCFRSFPIEDNEIDIDKPISTLLQDDMVFANVNYGKIGSEKRKYLFKQLYENAPAVISRTFILNNHDDWLDAFRNYANILATDKVNGHDWAWVDHHGMIYRLPRKPKS